MIQERSIKIAFDKISGKVLEANEIFDNKKDGFVVRKQFHKNEVELFCCECGQILNVSTSKYDRLHFKHQPNANYCILKEGKLSPEETEKFTKILYAKESKRHIDLKNKIADRLVVVKGVDKQSIAVDNKFIIREGEKRKPDVYCRYFDKEIVFEIQLSDLSLRYVLSRYEFYKKNGIYLIWILDNFDVKGQSQLERDIKYLTQYENFFKLDEKVNEFKLICDYKFNFLTKDNKLLSKWLNKSVRLSDLKFSKDIYQVYYYDFGKKKIELEAKQKLRAKELAEIERIKIEENRQNRANQKASHIIDRIKYLRKTKYSDFDSVSYQISELDDYELSVFNEKLNINTINPLIRWISTAKLEDLRFLEFIIDCKDIKYDVCSQDSNGTTPLLELLNNKNFEFHSKVHIIKKLIQRGYYINGIEFEKISFQVNDNFEKTKQIKLLQIVNNLKDKSLVESVFEHSQIIFIIESTKYRKIVGFKYKSNEWIAFANNSIENYTQYWEYIELSFKYYGLWEKLIILDKKRTFHKKLEKLYDSFPEQQYDCDELFQELYPELIGG